MLGKAVGEGAPSQKTCRSPRTPNPSRKEDSMLRRTLMVLAAALVAPALALAAHSGGRATPAPSFPVTVHAANGTVTVTKRPTRIVALSPTATEDLYAIGAGAQVVAV